MYTFSRTYFWSIAPIMDTVKQQGTEIGCQMLQAGGQSLPSPCVRIQVQQLSNQGRQLPVSDH